jgi:flagellar assembly protein FliH
MSSSPLIPKEKQSAYQRWELGSFDAPVQQPPVNVAANAERVRQISERAHADGYAAGYREGLNAGNQAALVESNTRAAQLDSMVTALTADLARLDRELAHEVVQLGLAIARKLVGVALQIRPDIVRQAVEDALRQVSHIRGPVSVIVNPEDAPLVRSYLDTAPPSGGWTLREDPAVACGGCRVETTAGEVDATLNQRWHRITSALGQPVDWVEP